LHSMHHTHMNGSNSKNAQEVKGRLAKGSSDKGKDAKTARESNARMTLKEREATKVLSQDIIDLIVARGDNEKEIRSVDAEHTDALSYGNATLKEVSSDVQFISILDATADSDTHGKSIFG
jgi:hypothetical protein